MTFPIHITFRGFPRSEAVQARVLERAERLARRFDRITSCKIVIEAPHRHQRKGRLFAVNVELAIPDGDVVASRERGQDHSHEDIYVAIRDAFDAIARALQGRVQRRRGEVKRHALEALGVA